MAKQMDIFRPALTGKSGNLRPLFPGHKVALSGDHEVAPLADHGMALLGDHELSRATDHKPDFLPAGDEMNYLVMTERRVIAEKMVNRLFQKDD